LISLLLLETSGIQPSYLVIVVVDGILEFSFELGSGPAQIQTRADTRVDDGKRHHVILRRQASDGSIELDSVTEFGESQGILKMLNTRGNIYIGKCYHISVKPCTQEFFTAQWVHCKLKLRMLCT
jgi:hypothetical protein